MPEACVKVQAVDVAGNLVGRWDDVRVPDTLPEALVEAARHASGLADVWLLHDGGVPMGRDGVVLVETGEGFGRTTTEPLSLPYLHAAAWQRPGWRTGVTAWVDARLAEAGETRIGPLMPVSTYDLACVARIATSGGTVYLKASGECREVVFAQLAAACPGSLAPSVLAADTTRGLLLTRDAGTSLLDSPDPAVWASGAEQLAALHANLDGEAWCSAGAERHAFAQLMDRFKTLLLSDLPSAWGLTVDFTEELRALVPALREAHVRVCRLGLPECASHGDAHPNNALVEGGCVRWFDWSEGALAHPFMDIGWMLAFLSRDAYAKQPARVADPELPERMWHAFLKAAGVTGGVRWEDAALLALAHRAVLYDAKFRVRVWTIPDWKPMYVPFYLRELRRVAGSLALQR